MVHRPLAVSLICGVRSLSWLGPVISERISWRPPRPRFGKIATASTIKPMPPSQDITPRHSLTGAGSSSMPLSTVAPEAVRPETASKYASDSE